MALDIRGSLKNTRISNNPFVVIDELLSNSIDAYLVRKIRIPSLTGLNVNFQIEFTNIDMGLDKENDKNEFSVICADNGVGFGDEEVIAFITKDTSYKDEVNINGIGKCKGSGRIQFLHYFQQMTIDSTYTALNGHPSRRILKITADDKIIDETSFKDISTKDSTIGTTFILSAVKPSINKKILKNIDVLEKFSARELKKHIKVSFLHRLITLKNEIGDFKISIETKYKGKKESETITLQDIPKVTEVKAVTIYKEDAKEQKTNEKVEFKIIHFKLAKKDYDLEANFIALCAKSAAVKEITGKYVREKSEINGYYHVVLIESDYLDDKVNEQRDDFEIVPDQSDLLRNNDLSWEQIYDEIYPTLSQMLSLTPWVKSDVLKNITAQYGITNAMIKKANVKIHHGDTERGIVERVFASFQKEILDDTENILEIKNKIKKLNPVEKGFREEINRLAWKFTSSLERSDMANLSQTIVRRAAVLEILDLAVNKSLDAQISSEEKNCDEKIIHHLFFPMGKDSTESKDHDIWLLNEEYYYYDYIASDRALSKIKLDNVPLFENSIDEEVEKLLQKNYQTNKRKRPDIAIFSKEGAAIIIEFKAPGVSLDDHTADLMEYAQLLAAKSNGKLKQFYGSLIGDTVNPNRIVGYKKYPSNQGWFGTFEITDYTTGKALGELRAEIIFYKDIVNRAQKRLDVYKKRLGLNF